VLPCDRRFVTAPMTAPASPRAGAVLLGAMAKMKSGRSFSNDRELIQMAKTLDLAAIAKKTGRTPEAVLKRARRLGVSIKGREREMAR
jgi:hypothetical protein